MKKKHNRWKFVTLNVKPSDRDAIRNTAKKLGIRMWEAVTLMIPRDAAATGHNIDREPFEQE